MPAWFGLLGVLLPALVWAQPQQVHLSYGFEPSQMVVMWSTAESSPSVVLYGLTPSNLTMKQSGTTWKFTYGNPNGLQYMHKVVLQVIIARRG